jgi:hypothetical protein
MHTQHQVPFIRENDVTYALTHTNSNKVAIQVLGEDLDKSFFRHSKCWHELTTGTKQGGLISTQLNKAYKKLREIRDVQE